MREGLVFLTQWLQSRGGADRGEKFRGRAIQPGTEFLGRQALGQFRETVEIEGFFRQADAELLRIDGIDLLFNVIFDRNQTFSLLSNVFLLEDCRPRPELAVFESWTNFASIIASVFARQLRLH